MVGLPAFLSKVSKFLAIIVSVIANSLLFARVFSLGHYCKIFYQLSSLFVDKLGFGGSQYLLYFINCLIPPLKHADDSDLKVVM